ncbi:MAG: T9SS type A sorting domain-containing protein [Chlorobi bacterium]|nr:T9SS type A sorting domain-containing protein [Chlorobiota bacterium]
MKTYFYLTLILSFLNINTFSAEIKIKKAETVAKNFLSERGTKNNELIIVSEHKSEDSNNPVYYIFNFKGTKGFIIISASDNVYPVLAYSFESFFNKNEEKPEAYTEWMSELEKQIDFAIKNKIKPDKKTSEAWKHYSNQDFKPAKTTKDVDPLLTTTWNQGCGYNSLCPADSDGPCGYVWAGCVATAMAQVMNYHEYPVSGEGSHSYTHYVYGEQSADFENTIYDWSNMPDGSGNAGISKLMYHCGVAVNMNYGPDGSGAYSSTAAAALRNYFKYTRNSVLTSKYHYTEENWSRLLRTEIDSGRPMYYSGYGTGGHAFNVDGYQGTDYFHFNWGWGGSYNGYFYLNDLTPGSYNFTNSQAAIAGMMPRDNYPEINCSNPVILTANVSYSGSTVSSANIANTYGSIDYQETGKEVVHQITTTYAGRIRASITDLNGNNLDVFILSDCNQDSLLAYGDSIAVADGTESGTYLIVVDGKYASEGTYTLTVNVPDEKADLIITDQKVGPDFIQANDLANVSFTVKNIGNDNAPSSKTKIYYSEDKIFDGSDIYIDAINIPALNSKSQYEVNQNILIPATASEGLRYIIFIADADNEVIETDELLNIESANFNVPAAGISDCSSSVALSDNVWYFGNTETDGQDNIEFYSWGIYPDKEIIHSISSTHSGIAEAEFTEKVPGNLTLLILSTCNENACIENAGIWNPEDTITHISFYMYAGVRYYLVVDGEEGVSGNYGLKINTPGACPEPSISYWGDTDLCTGQSVNLSVSWDYGEAKWYKNNVLINGETNTYLQVSEPGDYKAEVFENGCYGFSDTVTVRVNDAPSSASISASGDTTFCEGNSVTLNLSTGPGYTVQWVKNGNDINGETGLSYIAEQTGTYSAKITNISCSIYSNEIKVKSNFVSPDNGDFVRISDSALVSWFSCDFNDNTDLSGHGNDYFYSGWNYGEDRNGNFNSATFFNGQRDNITTSNSFDNPDTFTLSLWFKTKSTQGGFLIGLGDNQWGESTLCDRIIYFDDTGRLYFGINDGTAKTISTTENYNDNIWHNVTASLSSGGMKLYVDGILKSEDNTVTQAGNFTGWWKIAHDIIDSGFTNVPANNYFNGTLDEIKIYERELLPEEVDFIFNENKFFTVSADNSNFCESGEANISLNNTTAFIEYQLRNDADNSAVGSPVTGNAGNITLPAGTLTQTTTFNILATNPQTGCSRELSDLINIEINDLPSAILSGGEDICENETSDITINLTGEAPWNITYTDGTDSFTETTSDNPYIFAVSDAGIYQITALSDANCNGINFPGTATINVNPLPEVNLGNDTSITVNDTLVLYAGEGFASYIWNDNSEEDTLTVIGSDFGIGNYDFSVTVADLNSCENSDTINITIQQGVNIEHFNDSQINIYPNPSQGIYFIGGIDALDIKTVKIFDLNGKIIQELNPSNEIIKIDLRNEPSGVYFIKISKKYNDIFIKAVKSE